MDTIKIVDVLTDEEAIEVGFVGDNLTGSKRLYTKFSITIDEDFIIQDSFTSVDSIKDDFKGVS